MTQNDDLVKMGEKPEKQIRRKRPDKTAQLEEGDCEKFLGNALEIASLPEIDTMNAEQVEKRIGEYFDICMKNNMKPSLAGMALALGTDREVLWEWTTTGRKGKAVTDILKKGKAVMKVLMEDYMQNGKINPVSGIFLMKNMGYTDQQQIIIAPANPLGDVQDRKTLEERYLQSVPDVIDAESAEVIDAESAESNL